MVRKERIPSWRKIDFSFVFGLVEETIEEDEGDEVEKEGRKGTLAAAA
jgi:hypothetical protein